LPAWPTIATPLHNLKDFDVRNFELLLPNAAGTIVAANTVTRFPHTAIGSTNHTTETLPATWNTHWRVGDAWRLSPLATPGAFAAQTPVLDITFDTTGLDFVVAVDGTGIDLDTTTLADGRHTLEILENGIVVREIDFIVDNAAIRNAQVPEVSDIQMPVVDGNYRPSFVVTSPIGASMNVSWFRGIPLQVSATQYTDSGVVNFTNTQIRQLGTLRARTQTRTNVAVPMHEFNVDVGTYAGSVELSYSGSSLGGERVRFSVYNPGTSNWDVVGTAAGVLSASVVVDAGVYAQSGIIRTRAEVVIVDNGADAFAWVADTQHLPHFRAFTEAWGIQNRYHDLSGVQGIYNVLMQHIAYEYIAGNLAFMTHSGDLISGGHYGHTGQEQWNLADEAFALLDAVGMPFGVVAGNHCVGNNAPFNFTNFARVFGAHRFAGQDHFGFHDEQNINNYNLITIGGLDFVFVHLGMGSEFTPATIAWFNGLIEQFPHRHFIIQVHQYLNQLGGCCHRDYGLFYDGRAYGGDRQVGQNIWQNLILPNPQVVMVLCGHDRASITNVRTRPDGSHVIEMMHNTQTTDLARLVEATNSYWRSGHDGFFRIMTITDDGMDFTTYSPFLDRYNALHPSIDTGSVEINWRETQRELNTMAFSAVRISDEVEIGRQDNVASGSTVQAPANAIPEGYSWFARVECTETNLVFTVAAYYDTAFDVVFDSQGGSAVETQYVAYGEQAIRPTDPTFDGHNFVNWYTAATGGEIFDFGTPITENITLYARWVEIEVTTFTVTFNSQGGSAIASQTVVDGERATRPADPTFDGHNFVNWYTAATGGEIFDFDTPITANITLYTHWVAVTITSPSPSAPPTTTTSPGNGNGQENPETGHWSLYGLVMLVGLGGAASIILTRKKD